MATVSGSPTQAGTRLATAAFTASPKWLRQTFDACELPASAAGEAPPPAVAALSADVAGVAASVAVNRLRESVPRG